LRNEDAIMKEKGKEEERTVPFIMSAHRTGPCLAGFDSSLKIS